ncbi:PLP-dependent aminotransferase family protein [Leucothrix mucor]|uniref:MocR-like pyridoxine biosynthesis transcription factor PdxR n=1 Tax=Leucothrix mucor TaxID=45248 RepID=UPI0003B45E4E|nr:PLP-dependent aminotransferase family protein [Leucothrix mucor]
MKSLWNRLIKLDRDSSKSLQIQIREAIVNAALERLLEMEKPLPSSRELAKDLNVARNTVVLAYQHLVDEGFLDSRERKGFFINPQVYQDRIDKPRHEDGRELEQMPAWCERLLLKQPSLQRNIRKNKNWKDYPYPFIFGQLDFNLIPIHEWRECVHYSLNVAEMRQWATDQVDEDDPLLIEQIQKRVLPRRGIWTRPENIMVTLGAQNALYLIASLLVGENTKVGIENPGYPDVRNIMSLKTNNLAALDVDEEGVVINDALKSCDVIYITPSHQVPSGVTMSEPRRRALLATAAEYGIVIIEDDFEAESNFKHEPQPALKSLRNSDQVIYVGSTSKTFAPGLRLGYMVAPAKMIHEARALRRLMYRHAPANNQRAAALFISLGHYDKMIGRLHTIYKERWKAMNAAIETHLPMLKCVPNFGGSSFWLEGPSSLDVDKMATALEQKGVVIEIGSVFFMGQDAPTNYFRLGFASIPVGKIEAGILMISHYLRDHS